MNIINADKKQKNQYYNPNLPLPIPPTDFVYDHQEEPTKPEKRWWKNWIGYLKDNGDNKLEESRGSMMVVATVISTMAFQTATNPPGGVWQENVSTKMKDFSCSEYNTCLAGTAVLARSMSNGIYHLFITLNTISFLASLSIILLLISWFPLKNKFCMWVLTISMCINFDVHGAYLLDFFGLGDTIKHCICHVRFDRDMAWLAWYHLYLLHGSLCVMDCEEVAPRSPQVNEV